MSQKLIEEIEALRERLDDLQTQVEEEADEEVEESYDEEDIDVTSEELEALRNVAAAAKKIRDLSESLRGGMGVGFGIGALNINDLGNIGSAVQNAVSQLQAGLQATKELTDALDELESLE